MEAADSQTKWRLARFDEILTRVDRRFTVDDSATYSCVGVRWYGKGAFVRERVPGFQLARKQQWVIRSGDVVYNKLCAWKGAFAVADEAVDECIVSDKFPTYRLDPDQVDPRFFRLFLQHPSLAEQASGLSKGAAAISKLTLNPPDFWRMLMRVPSLNKQRRVVARMEEAERNIEAARSLWKEAAATTDALVASIHVRAAAGRTVRLGEIFVLDERQTPTMPGTAYPQVGVRAYGHGLFAKTPVYGSGTTYRAFNQLYTGAVVLSQVKGWEGAIAVCPESLANWYVSPEYRTLRCRQDMAVSEYIAVLVESPWFWTKLRTLTRGVGGRRERTRPEAFLALEMPMPTAEQQMALVNVLEKVRSVRAMRSGIADQLDALASAVLDRAFSEGL